MDFKKRKIIQIHKEIREKKQRIKKEWVETGACENITKILHEKRKPSISPDELPF